MYIVILLIIILVVILSIGAYKYITTKLVLTAAATTAVHAATGTTTAVPATDADAPTPKVDIVVSQYNENIDFLNTTPFSKHNIICYSKGIKQPKCPNCVEIIPLTNVGKCDHTYLYHIINNYDNLANVTIFLPGSCLMNDIKRYKTYKTIQYVEQTNNTVFIGANYNNVYKDLYNFKLDSYGTTNKENRQLNQDTKLKPCEIRPFGKWYNNNFGNMKTTLVDYTSIFAVAKNHIHQHPRSYYEKLISYIDSDVSPECGHYVERAWVAIFSPLPAACLYNNYA
jgi:hypothetical protein